jgi:hypothetical protein
MLLMLLHRWVYHQTNMGKAELFTEATKRNALRRESGLPLLNIPDEIERAQNLLEWKKFRKICAQHKAVRDQIAARIKSELAAKGFDCLSHGERMLLGAKVEIEFHDFLHGIGVKIPSVNGTRYGSANHSAKGS